MTTTTKLSYTLGLIISIGTVASMLWSPVEEAVSTLQYLNKIKSGEVQMVTQKEMSDSLWVIRDDIKKKISRESKKIKLINKGKSFNDSLYLRSESGHWYKTTLNDKLKSIERENSED